MDTEDIEYVPVWVPKKGWFLIGPSVSCTKNRRTDDTPEPTHRTEQTWSQGNRHSTRLHMINRDSSINRVYRLLRSSTHESVHLEGHSRPRFQEDQIPSIFLVTLDFVVSSRDVWDPPSLSPSSHVVFRFRHLNPYFEGPKTSELRVTVVKSLGHKVKLLY